MTSIPPGASHVTSQAGAVSVNSYSEGPITTPFGGWKQSGFGGAEKSKNATLLSLLGHRTTEDMVR